MINIDLIWAIASILIALALFYFANTSEIKNKFKTWVSLVAGIMISMGLVTILFWGSMLCAECAKYCQGNSCKIVYKSGLGFDTMTDREIPHD